MKGRTSLSGRLRTATRHLKRGSPTILTCVGAIGVITTAVLAVRATPKAMELIEKDSRQKHDGNPYASSKLEIVKACWACYIPAASTGMVAIACIFGANVLNRRQQTALTSAYALADRALRDYKRKVKELYGEETHRNVMESLAIERSNAPHISASGFSYNSSLDFEDAGEDERLFYDSFSDRYFQATISQVLQAEYHLNRNFTLGGEATLNQFYEFLGIDPVKGCEDLAWWVTDEIYWIDFNHNKAVMEDGLECYILEMVFAPTNEPPD